MKRTFCLLVAAMLFGSICFGQDSLYQDQVDKIFVRAGSLNDFIKSNTLDFESYDKWFKDFKVLSDKLVSDFLQSHNKKNSFQAVKEGINQLSLIWNTLKEVQYSESQYQESITAGDVTYAHQWKNTALEQRKKALDIIPKAIDYFRQAKDSLTSEN
jgi:hypothetical protein